MVHVRGATGRRAGEGAGGVLRDVGMILLRRSCHGDLAAAGPAVPGLVLSVGAGRTSSLDLGRTRELPAPG